MFLNSRQESFIIHFTLQEFLVGLVNFFYLCVTLHGKYNWRNKVSCRLRKKRPPKVQKFQSAERQINIFDLLKLNDTGARMSKTLVFHSLNHVILPVTKIKHYHRAIKLFHCLHTIYMLRYTRIYKVYQRNVPRKFLMLNCTDVTNYLLLWEV